MVVFAMEMNNWGEQLHLELAGNQLRQAVVVLPVRIFGPRIEPPVGDSDLVRA